MDRRPPCRRLPSPAIALSIAALAPALCVGRAEAAQWIGFPGLTGAAPEQGLALQFRREIELKAPPQTLRVRVSADSRYVLYVNGLRAAAGPARGDLGHWRYETIDIAPDLKPGANVIAAEVWSDGAAAPLAQVTTGHTAFWLQTEHGLLGEAFDSGPGWRVRVDPSRSVSPARAQLRQEHVPGFYAAGAPETLDAKLEATDWNASASGAPGWTQAAPANDGQPPSVTLQADALPSQLLEPIAGGRLVRAVGVEGGAFPQGPVLVPAHAEAKLLIDAGRVQSAYPLLLTSGGAGATVSLTYAEALYDPANPLFAEAMAKEPGEGPELLPRFFDRATVDHGVALGLTDTVKPDGDDHHRFSPFWWRTWRFVEISVKTGDQPLTLDSFQALETRYPFAQTGRFVSSDDELNRVWRIGWDTARLDAHETYMDTAYWEQLQYIGDTRLQMLISYAVSGDPRLAVQALDAFDASSVVEGIPQSAYPSTSKNLIPPFALLWIDSLHDYWMRQPDRAVLKRTLPGARAVLDWYAPYLREAGVLRMTPGWLFVDWRPTLSEMNPRHEARPDSCVITLMYYGALRDAADLETAVGSRRKAREDQNQAAKVRTGLLSQCWSDERGLFADAPAKTRFSQHANALAVLYDLVPRARQREVLDRITTRAGALQAPDGIIPVTYYFAFYLAEAFDHAGLADRYLGMLQPWREMVRRGFTTYPENPDPSRSDSHAWSAHPTAGLLTYVAGIHPAAPGFARVRIEPHLGPLTRLDAAAAHPLGLIETLYVLGEHGGSATITLPAGLGGDFVWKGRRRPLHGGRNRFGLD
ncbi:alpha-L-rhamnosidase-related protein [Phenylobacterium montanum]|uniref:Alpha-L-rhamnosidase six-hairpin glycosidase domain-containing protein n=1 Tax=Phenylobacterium montanum TaxID=2823693 RepID=A0A975G3T4_9CAUL|nr:hypothetical protein [Caulobacter sp. S6]QUD90620.1 hypothetical protein KCG34_12485 [Caulobacter sp. S6]